MADNKKEVSPSLHKWRFFRSGGFDQVRLETGADLKALGELDPKLWAALSCPTSGLEFDSKTLELIDSDGDGHVRVPEIVAAVQWTTSVLKNPEDLTKGSPRCRWPPSTTARPRARSCSPRPGRF